MALGLAGLRGSCGPMMPRSSSSLMTRLARANPSLSFVWRRDVLARSSLTTSSAAGAPLAHAVLGGGRRHLVDVKLAQPAELPAATPVALAEFEDVGLVEGAPRRLVQPVLGDGADFPIANEDALDAGGPGKVRRLVEHVAATDEVLGTGGVEHGPRVDHR